MVQANMKIRPNMTRPMRLLGPIDLDSSLTSISVQISLWEHTYN